MLLGVPPPFVLGGAEIAQRGMASLSVVEDLDILEEGGLQLPARLPGAAIEQLGLQGGEEALRHGVVVGISATAHGALEPCCA